MFVWLGEAIRPSIETLDVAAARYCRKAPEEEISATRSHDEQFAWLLSSLARRHLHYRFKCDPECFELTTAVLQKSSSGDGAFDPWFEQAQLDRPESASEYRVLLHVYEEHQEGHELWWNIFDHAYAKLDIKLGTHKHADLKRDTRPRLRDIAGAYARGPPDEQKIIGMFNHPSEGSRGWPTRVRR